MSELDEYSGKIRTTVEASYTCWAIDKDDFVKKARAVIEGDDRDGLNYYEQGDIKNIEVENVRVVD